MADRITQYVGTNGHNLGESQVEESHVELQVQTIEANGYGQQFMVASSADLLMEKLDPRGVIVVLECEHMCMEMRGIRKVGARTVTSAVRGAFQRDGKVRAEAGYFRWKAEDDRNQALRSRGSLDDRTAEETRDQLRSSEAARDESVAAITILPVSKRTRIPVSTGRLSSRDALRPTRATVSIRASRSTVCRTPVSTSGRRGKSSAEYVWSR